MRPPSSATGKAACDAAGRRKSPPLSTCKVTFPSDFVLCAAWHVLCGCRRDGVQAVPQGTGAAATAWLLLRCAKSHSTPTHPTLGVDQTLAMLVPTLLLMAPRLVSRAKLGTLFRCFPLEFSSCRSQLVQQQDAVDSVLRTRHFTIIQLNPSPNLQPCGVGEYLDIAGGTVCLNCPGGRYNPTPAQSTCLDCSPGSRATSRLPTRF